MIASCVYQNSLSQSYPNAHPCVVAPSVVEPTTEIPCDPTPRRLTVACGYRKQHRIENVVDENGAAIDTGGEALSFIVETANGVDVETGPATMLEPGIFIFDVDLASRTPGEYRWAIRTVDRGAVVVYGDAGDYVVLDIAKEGDPFGSSESSVCVSVTSGGQPLEGATVVATDIVTNDRFAVVVGSEGLAFFNLPVGTYDFQPFIESFEFGDPVRREVTG